jgi:type IV pilus assembly protein PilM
MVSWTFKKRNRRPIGLDLGHDFVKMIQLDVRNGYAGVIAAGKAQLAVNINDDPEARKKAEIEAIKQIMEENNFDGRNVVSCLPNDRLKITSLRLAEGETSDIDSFLHKEVGQRFGLNPAEDIINYMLAGNVRQGNEIKQELILLAADNQTIRSHIDMLEKADMRPVAIDAVPCALFRAFERNLRRQMDATNTSVFIDVGSKFTTAVFSRGSDISFVKQIPIGGEKLNKQIATRLGISVQEASLLRENMQAEIKKAEGAGACDVQLDNSTRQIIIDAITTIADELARELSLCFRYYTVTFRGKRIEKAVFAGGEAYEDILVNVLKRQLAVEIEIGMPLKGFDMKNVGFDGDRRSKLSEWAVAVGLSLKGSEAVFTEGQIDERN